METTLSTIIATAVLHNIAILLKDDEPPIDDNIIIREEAFHK